MNIKSLSKIVASILFSLFHIVLLAQSATITGTILDSKTNEAIPFANVAVKGTALGTSTDFDGNFSLKINDLKKDKIIISSVGYTTTEKNASFFKKKTIIKLASESVNVATVEVKRKRRKLERDTTALFIFAQVVKNKAHNKMTDIDYYEYNAYTKKQYDLFNFNIEAAKKSSLLKGMEVAFDYIDTTERGYTYLPILLKEEVSDYYYKGKGFNLSKEKIYSQKYSGIVNENIAKVMDDQANTYDVYGEVIPVMDKPFMGPFSSSGKLGYHYTVGDTAMVKNHYCYQLYFVGKSVNDLLFKGYAWVDSATWGIKEIELKIGDKVNMNWINDFYFFQSFEYLENKHWFVDREVNRKAYGFSKKEDKFNIRITTDRSKKDIVLHKQRNNNFYAGDPIELLISAESQDDAYWQTVRHDTLSANEQSITSFVDSVKTTKKYKLIDWATNLATSAFIRTGPIEFGRIYKLVSWNDIEGIRFRVGVRTNKFWSKNYRASGHIAYSTKDKKLKYKAQIFTHLPSNNNKWHSLQASYMDDYTVMGIDNPLLSYDNFANSLLRTGSFDDLMKMKHFNATYKREWIKDFTTTLAIDHKIFETVPGRFEFKHRNPDGTFRKIKEITTSEISFKLRYAPKEQYFENPYIRFPMISKKPILTFQYTLGLKNILLSDFNYHKFKLNVKYRNINILGYTKYQAETGLVLGKVPYPLLEIHPGNKTFLYNKFRYNLLNDFEFASDVYGSLWIDHHFDGFFFNKIPGISKLQLRFLLTSKFLYGRITDKNQKGNLYVDFPTNKNGDRILNEANFHAEFGFGIENILKIGRIDFVWRLTQRDKPGVQKWGIRLALQPKF